MKTILCLTDYTPSSKIALSIALRFAERLNYKIILVHVEPIDRIEFKEDSRSKLSKFSDENTKNQSGKSDNLIHHELVYGNIVEQCELLAEKYDPSLIQSKERATTGSHLCCPTLEISPVQLPAIVAGPGRWSESTADTH